ncbi:MAG: hypothetical protein WA638_13380, partial [Candidatus Acidiferrales bacterium]
GLTGRDAETALERSGITVNKNAIPFDTQPPMKAGGIRVGSPAVTTRGMKEKEMEQIARWIAEVLSQIQPSAAAEKAPVQASDTERRVRAEVAKFAARFPLYAQRLAEADAAQHAQPTSTTA